MFEYKPSPHFRLDVVYKMGGRINGTLRYYNGGPKGILLRRLHPEAAPAEGGP